MNNEARKWRSNINLLCIGNALLLYDILRMHFNRVYARISNNCIPFRQSFLSLVLSISCVVKDVFYCLVSLRPVII